MRTSTDGSCVRIPTSLLCVSVYTPSEFMKKEIYTNTSTQIQTSIQSA